LTTKQHLACEQSCKVMAFVVTGGQRGDGPQFTAVLQRIRVSRIHPALQPDASAIGQNRIT